MPVKHKCGWSHLCKRDLPVVFNHPTSRPVGRKKLVEKQTAKPGEKKPLRSLLLLQDVLQRTRDLAANPWAPLRPPRALLVILGFLWTGEKWKVWAALAPSSLTMAEQYFVQQLILHPEGYSAPRGLWILSYKDTDSVPPSGITLQ